MDIREASDITEEMVEEVAGMRDGLYGNAAMTWEEVIDMLERDTDDDWGSDLQSPAIRALQRRVRALLKADG